MKHNTELYGGTVRVESELGKGAKFTSLPVEDVDETHHMTLPVPPLLVVDDEKNMRLSLQTMLGDEGYSVLAVESAEAGLELLGKETVFMVITDARLGGMSGLRFPPQDPARWPDLPILMITAYATPKLAVEVIKAGAMDYLAKPFAPEELLHVVGRCAERHRLLQTNAQLLARASRNLPTRSDRRRLRQDARVTAAHPNRGSH